MTKDTKVTKKISKHLPSARFSNFFSWTKKRETGNCNQTFKKPLICMHIVSWKYFISGVVMHCDL